jgi:hypothetical protein
MLPMAQRASVQIVHLDRIEPGFRIATAQPGIQPMSEGAEIPIVAVAQREQAEGQLRQFQRMAHRLCDEAQRRVRRIALTGGADHKQRTPKTAYIVRIERRDIDQTRRCLHPAQCLHTASGQVFGDTGLAGVDDDDFLCGIGVRIDSRRRGSMLPAQRECREHQPAGNQQRRRCPTRSIWCRPGRRAGLQRQWQYDAGGDRKQRKRSRAQRVAEFGKTFCRHGRACRSAVNAGVS